MRSGKQEAEESPEIWPIARGKVRYVGEAVAAVVAESRYQAEDAADAVLVDYDALPSVTNPEEAMKDGAPQLYPKVKNNLGPRWDRDHGDIEAAFQDAPVVAKARIRSQRLSGVPMETRAVAAAPDPLINGVTVWTSTQAPHWNRNSIADALNIPATRVRVIAPEVGGGFGVKIGAYQEDFIVAALALQLKRPVKWIETRSENFLATHHGRDQWADIEIAGEADGRIRGLRMDVVQDLGAYPKGTDLPELTGRMSCGCYDVPALEFRSVGVYTNTMAVGAYRGAGRPEAAYYVERAIDLLADAAGIDPAEVRQRNFIPPFDGGYTTASGRGIRHRRLPESARPRRSRLLATRSSAPSRRRPAAGWPLSRHRHGLVRRDLRLRAVRERHCSRRAERRCDCLHRHLATRPGAGDDASPRSWPTDSASRWTWSASTTAIP